MILTLNAGSSSLKFGLFEDGRAVARGAFEAVTEAPVASAVDGAGAAIDAPVAEGGGHEAVFPALFGWAAAHGDVRAVGHRIVHGGERAGPARVEDALLGELEVLCPLAPLHQVHGLAAIRAVRALRPGLAQVACFDTAFHRTMPEVARAHALPAALGFRRYGFHGLSYEWIAGRLPPGLAQGRVIVAHLGSGASLCAMVAGRSVETTMGTTPLDGLVMGTRCGALDPGVVLALVRRLGVDAAEHLLYQEAGLQGVSGVASDMRRLHEAPEGAAAIELFVYRAAALMGQMAAAMGGVEGVVFTGGIGEHDAAVREAIVARMAWLGPVKVLVIGTDEEAVIARQVAGLVG